MKNRNQKGITLISLIITIIILIIISTISIGTLGGKSGIIKRTKYAKETTEIAQEIDILKICTALAMGEDPQGNVTEVNLRKELNKIVKNYTLEAKKNKFKVTYESGRSYIVYTNGSILENGDSWENQEKVTYEYNGATSGNTEKEKELIYGSAYGTLPTPEKKFVVTYNYNGGIEENTITSTMSSYEFGGWYKESTFNTQVTASTQVTTTDNHTIYAKWTGGGIVLPTPTKTGYTFEYWCSDSKLSNKVGTGGKIYNPTSNITLYAKWKLNNYTISYNANGGNGSMPIDSVEYNSLYTIRNNTFTRPGYSFKGWNENADGTGKDWTNNIGKEIEWTYTQNITLYAIWNLNPVVTYEYNGATGGNTEKTKEVIYGSTYGELATPEKKFVVTYNYNGATGGNASENATGTYNFGGWYKENTYSNQVVESTQVTINNKHTLYAKWTGGEITLPNPTKTGYIFEYWCSDPELSNKVGAGGATYTPTSNVTLYAKWKELAKYTITYNKNTTSSVSNMPGNQTKTQGISIKLSSTIPSRSGYTFQGWSANSAQSGSGEYQAGATYTKDANITLYAVWSRRVPVTEHFGPLVLGKDATGPFQSEYYKTKNKEVSLWILNSGIGPDSGYIDFYCSNNRATRDSTVTVYVYGVSSSGSETLLWSKSGTRPAKGEANLWGSFYIGPYYPKFKINFKSTDKERKFTLYADFSR